MFFVVFFPVIGIDFIAPRLRVSEDEGLIRLGVGITNASLGRPIVLSLQTSDITALSESLSILLLTYYLNTTYITIMTRLHVDTETIDYLHVM